MFQKSRSDIIESLVWPSTTIHQQIYTSLRSCPIPWIQIPGSTGPTNIKRKISLLLPQIPQHFQFHPPLSPSTHQIFFSRERNSSDFNSLSLTIFVASIKLSQYIERERELWRKRWLLNASWSFGFFLSLSLLATKYLP